MVAALIVLLFAFRTFVAAPLPVTTAVIALMAGLAIVGFAGHAFDVPTIAPTLGIMLGLAVGNRLLPLHHQPPHAPARGGGRPPGLDRPRGRKLRARLSSSPEAPWSSPCSASISAASRWSARSDYATAIVVAVAVVAAITLLPALLGLLGKRIQVAALPARRAQAHQGPPRRLGEVGRRAPQAPGGRIGRRDRRPDRPRDPDARPEAGRPRLRPAAHRHDRPPGLRRPHRGIRRRHQRAAAGRGEPRLQPRPTRPAGSPAGRRPAPAAPGGGRAEPDTSAAGPGAAARRGGANRPDPGGRSAAGQSRAGDRQAERRPVGLARRGRQVGQGGRLLGHPEDVSLRLRDPGPGQPPPRRDDPRRHRGHRDEGLPSAAPPPATSTSPTRSATSCRW